jgi:hypothetical protein
MEGNTKKGRERLPVLFKQPGNNVIFLPISKNVALNGVW